MSSEAHHPFKGRRIVVGVCGGIAAYKAALLVRELVKREAEVHVLMTSGAREFIGELTFQALTGRPVFTDLFDLRQESEIGHIQVADAADLMIVAPATANTIARLAAGMADDPVAAVALATRAPILLAPSMNVNMWENPITQRNLRTLAELRGVTCVGPGSGFLACKWIGTGRLAEPEEIIVAAERRLVEQDLAGLQVVITAGPTREPLDPVRFLSNRSTGKMGFALAGAAVQRGASVQLVSGPTSLAAAPGVDLVEVSSAEEMNEAVVSRAARADVVVCSAAVADYRPIERSSAKLKKNSLGDSPSLGLQRTTDILAGLGAARGSATSPILVGFAAESGDPVTAAASKLESKGCDLVVANDISRDDIGFGSDSNEVTIVSRSGNDKLARMSKDELAHRIWSRVLAVMQEGARSGG